MRGIFWNCNGFRDPKKFRFISDLTKEKSLDFIALLETRRKSFTSPFLKNLCAGRDFIWHVKEHRGRSGGILLGIDLSRLDIGAIDEGDY
jgi:exonuclease III